MKKNIVKLFIQSSCSSSRKAKTWLEEKKVPYELIHITKQGFPKEQMEQLLRYTENGFEDIIKKGHLDEEMEEMSFNQLIDHLVTYPNMIKTPVLFQAENKILIGFNEEEIGVFLPRKRKDEKMKQYPNVI